LRFVAVTCFADYGRCCCSIVNNNTYSSAIQPVGNSSNSSINSFAITVKRNSEGKLGFVLIFSEPITLLRRMLFPKNGLLKK